MSILTLDIEVKERDEQGAEYRVSVMVDKEGGIIVKLYDEVSGMVYLFAPEEGLESETIQDIKNALKRTKKGGVRG